MTALESARILYRSCLTNGGDLHLLRQRIGQKCFMAVVQERGRQVLKANPTEA